MSLRAHLARIPSDVAKALGNTFRDMIDHFLREEWDDAQVDAGRFAEAVLRYLEWKLTAGYTPIDGRSKPSRKKVVNQATQDTSLPPALRLQLPQGVELIMDFRNNRNAAHLGDIEANHLDATTVVQVATWIMGEIVRTESKRTTGEIQDLLNQLSERRVPLIQKVGETPIVLDTGLGASERALVLLYEHREPIAIHQLRVWAEYSNSTQWRDKVIAGLRKRKLVHMDRDGMVHLLRPGEAEAQRILIAAGSAVTL